MGAIERVLAEGVATVCARAGRAPAELTHAFFGLPGYGEVGNDAAALLDAAARTALGHGRYACDNDMVCGWAGSLAARDGINVISGTGSIAYGRRAGRRARVGGWGEVVGDEGSAFWIGARGLGAFSRMSDGRLPVGPLHAALREHLGLTADLDLVRVVPHGRREIAALAPVVAAAAERGDEQAAAVFRAAGDELAALADAARLRLGFEPDEVVPVSCSGGVFAAGALVTEPLRRALRARHAGHDLRAPLHSAVVGAALYAAKLHGTPLGEAALARLSA